MDVTLDEQRRTETEGVLLNTKESPETDVKPDFFPVILMTGLSGGGKTSVLNVFEDMRFFIIDGLPLELVPEVLPLLSRESLLHYKGMVLGVDFTQQSSAKDFSRPLINLLSKRDDLRMLFVEAESKIIMRRYATTRRPHPLEVEGMGLEQAVLIERERLQPLRSLADMVIDTTALSIHDLRRLIQQHCADMLDKPRSFRVHLLSFGFKYGPPAEADMMYDLRFLPNPFFVESLKEFNGQDKRIVDYVLGQEPGVVFLEHLTGFLAYVLPLYEAEGRYRITICFGCTGGKHRSVAVTEAVADKLKALGYAVTMEHRHINLG